MSIALSHSISSQSMPIQSGLPDAPDVPGQTVVLTHRDAGFSVAGTSAHGLYADGSPWVQQSAQTTLTATTPTAVLHSGTIDGTSYVDAPLHGMMRDPGQAQVPTASLADMQDSNMRRWRNQGWDGRRVNTNEALAYEAVHNVDPGATGQPLALNAPASLVKAVCDPDTDDQREVITNYGILTVVPLAPVHADSARPAMANPDKSPPWRTSDIVLPDTVANSYANLPTYAGILGGIDLVIHMIDTNLSATRATNLGPQGGYGGAVAEDFARAGFWLVYGGGSEAERLEVARMICQVAEDLKWRMLQGGIVTSNGGWCQMADVILGLASELIPGHFESARDLTVVTTNNRSTVNWPPVGSTALAETRRVQPVTQAIIDIDPQYISAPYPQKMLGWPEWCSDFGTNKALPTGETNQLGVLENALTYDPGVSIGGDDKPGYRHITMKAMVPLTLFLRAVGSSYITDHQTYFDYIDRHMGEIISQNGGYEGVGYASAAFDDWMIEAWREQRGIEGIWASVPVMTILGQSENKIGVFSNSNLDARAGQMPTLLPGVDARYALKDRHEDRYTGYRVITADPDAIANQDINPGFVAIANLWHLGSGGMPLRMVDGTRSGTDMTDMMDDDETGRNFDEEVAVVKLASVAFGSVSDVVYNWWNAEAGAAQTLWESRAPHFFGVAADGSDFDFVANTLEHCLIDTTERGFGLLPLGTKVHMMMPGIKVRNAEGTYDPPQPNYTTDTAGNAITGMIAQNGIPSYQERLDFLTDAPAANTGRALISPALVRFGDYVNGAQLAQPAQSSIHPSITERDGQVLFAQDLGAGLLIAQGYYDAPVLDRVEWASDGSYADFVYAIPDGATLTTQRIQDAETVPSPRPHQQDVMGFVIYRNGDTDRTARPVFRTGLADATTYPTAYRGTVTIQDTGTGSGGAREGVVRVTPEEAFANGDVVHFGTDGNYGDFCLHGAPDYDARLYRDGLRAHISALESGLETYPGIPVRAQEIAMASGITMGPTLTFADSEQGQDFGATSQWRRNGGLQPNVVSNWMVKPTVGYARADSADGNLSLAAPSGSTVVTACCDVRLSFGETSGTLLLRLLDITGASFDGEFGLTLPAGTEPTGDFTDSGAIDMGGGTWRVWAKMPAASVASGDRVIYDIPSSSTASDRVFDLAQPALFYADLTPTEIENLGPALAAP
ncbi:hypothetical protein KUL25_21600 [Rhodobacteraceae bacterium N5(2021)]|uniref:Uncharacterized protein n=1 Tax=Gymnodinialimonas phycosphaerae TaxID=2841589 RepID=A0A975TYN0_9RHOB|nr:hypothetical protein [Gymnodinialimonas phycosphaerae]MBY4895365.1 hypothetical protein [Gymnodinialimonas phycosphaerae]